MIPTFDISNIINRAVRALVAVVANPVVILVGVSSTLAILAAVYINFFDGLNIPSIDFLQFNFEENAWLSLFCYIIDYDMICDIWSFVSSALITMLTATISFIGSLLVGYWILQVARAIRASAKDFSS